MRHAGPEALDRLEDVLSALRAVSALKEKSRGAFYSGGRAFIHFHEHGAALYADMRGRDDFDRFDVTTPTQRAAFLAETHRRLTQATRKRQ